MYNTIKEKERFTPCTKQENVEKIKKDLQDWLEKFSTKNLYSYFRSRKDILEKIKEHVKEHYGFISENLAETCYLFLNDKKIETVSIICNKSKKVKKFKNFKDGYSDFCGLNNDCSCFNEYKMKKIREYYDNRTEEEKEKIREKKRKTYLKNYGVDNPSKLEAIKEKKKITYLTRYGVKNPILYPEIKKKAEQTNLRKFGSRCPLSNEKIKLKAKKTFLKKYGVDNPSKKEEIKKKIVRKIKETSLKKYGVEHPNQRHIPKTVLQKINDPEWLRYQHHALKKCIDEIAKENNVCNDLIRKKLKKFNITILTYTRSQDEKEIEDFLIKNGYNVEITTRKIIKPYELDIFLPDKNLAIEYCGLFWHSESRLGKDYHLNKLKMCLEKGIKLITLFSNEWIGDKENTKNKILWILKDKDWKLYENKIGDETIFVDRRWTEGKFLCDCGYKLIEVLEPKKWYFDKKKNLFEECNKENFLKYGSIWDCGWYVYKKI